MLDIFPSAHIHNIDRDASALSTSKSLSAGIGYADQMSFACIDVSKQDEVKGATKWDEFDVVFLAALVGMNTTSKLAVLAGLVAKMRPGALVAVRSAKGLRAVLYPVRKIYLCGYEVASLMLMGIRYSSLGMTWRGSG